MFKKLIEIEYLITRIKKAGIPFELSEFIKPYSEYAGDLFIPDKEEIEVDLDKLERFCEENGIRTESYDFAKVGVADGDFYGVPGEELKITEGYPNCQSADVFVVVKEFNKSIVDDLLENNDMDICEALLVNGYIVKKKIREIEVYLEFE